MQSPDIWNQNILRKALLPVFYVRLTKIWPDEPWWWEEDLSSRSPVWGWCRWQLVVHNSGQGQGAPPPQNFPPLSKLLGAVEIHPAATAKGEHHCKNIIIAKVKRAGVDIFIKNLAWISLIFSLQIVWFQSWGSTYGSFLTFLVWQLDLVLCF